MTTADPNRRHSRRVKRSHNDKIIRLSSDDTFRQLKIEVRMDTARMPVITVLPEQPVGHCGGGIIMDNTALLFTHA